MIVERQARYYASITSANELWHRAEAAFPVHVIHSLYNLMPRCITAELLSKIFNLGIHFSGPMIANLLKI